MFGQQRHTTILIDGPYHREHLSIQLGFDHGRFVTPWLHVIGNKHVKNPFIHIEFIKTGAALSGVRAEVLDYDEKTHHVAGHPGIHHSQKHMKAVYDDFHDPEKWPKRIFVKYTWKTRHETDVEFALTALLSMSVFGMAVMWARSVISYKKHLMKFFRDTVIEDSIGHTPQRPIPTQGTQFSQIGQPWDLVHGAKAD